MICKTCNIGIMKASDHIIKLGESELSLEVLMYFWTCSYCYAETLTDAGDLANKELASTVYDYFDLLSEKGEKIVWY